MSAGKRSPYRYSSLCSIQFCSSGWKRIGSALDFWARFDAIQILEVVLELHETCWTRDALIMPSSAQEQHTFMSCLAAALRPPLCTLCSSKLAFRDLHSSLVSAKIDFFKPICSNGQDFNWVPNIAHLFGFESSNVWEVHCRDLSCYSPETGAPPFS